MFNSLHLFKSDAITTTEFDFYLRFKWLYLYSACINSSLFHPPLLVSQCTVNGSIPKTVCMAIAAAVYILLNYTSMVSLTVVSFGFIGIQQISGLKIFLYNLYIPLLTRFLVTPVLVTRICTFRSRPLFYTYFLRYILLQR